MGYQKSSVFCLLPKIKNLRVPMGCTDSAEVRFFNENFIEGPTKPRCTNRSKFGSKRCFSHSEVQKIELNTMGTSGLPRSTTCDTCCCSKCSGPLRQFIERTDRTVSL